MVVESKWSEDVFGGRRQVRYVCVWWTSHFLLEYDITAVQSACCERVFLWQWFFPLCVLIRVPCVLVFQHLFAGLLSLRWELWCFRGAEEPMNCVWQGKV